MSQMPEIKPVVNKEPERDKKKAGFLARLFGGGASGGGAGLGGFGGAGAGGLAGGGILATKAGVLALVLVGTTVAGGIGMVGYRLFGPGAEMTGNGDNLQLFASKPKENASADGQNGAKGDGTSASLQYLSQANTSPKEGDAAAAGAAKDATAGSATGGDAAASAGGANGPLNAAGNSGNGVSHAMLKNTGKFGQLSGPNSGGGGTSAVASAAPQKAPGFDANAAAKGSLGGFKKTAAASIHGGTSRSLAGKHFGGAYGQALGVMGNQRGAQSSYAAGQTYDGAASGGSNIGNNGTPIGGAGSVGSSGAAQPKTMPAPSMDQNTSQNIPTPPGVPMAPWQSQIQKAQMLIGLAVALLFAAKLLAHTGVGLWATRIIGWAVVLIGVMVASLGAQIAHGKYGQTLQGGLLGAAGAGLVLAGIMAGTASDGNTQASGTNSTATDATKTTNIFGNASSGSSDTGMLGGVNPFIILGGGLALAGLAGTMMMPPKKYPAQDANDPDWPKPTKGFFGYQQYPSEKAVKSMVA